MKKLLSVILMSCAFLSVNAQTDSRAQKYAETITKEDLYDYLSILASDALEGRETGERGQKMAATFISNHFEDIGLLPPVKDGEKMSYFQPVELYKNTPGEIYLKVKNNRYDNYEKVVFYGSADTGEEVSSEIVFAGNGTPSDYEQVEIEDKAVLVLVNNIQASQGAIETATKKGATTVFVASTTTDEEFVGLASQFKGWLSGGNLTLEKPKTKGMGSGVFFVAPSVINDIFNTPLSKLKEIAETPDKLKKVKTSKVVFKTEQKTKMVNTENVLGYLEGSDKKEELVVITAHYDHIGRQGDKINNGADDDGSGTSAIMELAEAFVKAKADGNGPRRSMLFMLVTGEEKGLLGSAYYAAHPVFPLENTIVDLNIDMIGRIDPEHKDNPNYVYLVGSNRLSTELHEISEKVNETYTQFELDYTYNDENHPDRIYYRSDHWNFAKNNVPIIFYFNGVHEDYHQPSDTIDKINFDMLTKRSKLVYYTAWVLANRGERPVVDKLQNQRLKKD
ncbi:M28 family peptidase [Fulvivirga sp. 29W222]|uniref:M28 family peptidase n=1 Tax=Fulvivirga marina TaxID=2494733 RepID=A0A937FV95_9BACT|nr:M28 family peptidase [Fulvivirga marina]MBL6444975.1 M28 family peptidase [Fulvivirga marina]